MQIQVTCKWAVYWHADCILTGWTGGASPLEILYESSANVVDTVFRNIRLDVELVDISYGGVVRFEDTKLANISLNHGKIVSTSRIEEGGGRQDTNAEGNDYDVEYTPVPVAERSMFGEEFFIADQTMSDCLYKEAADGVVLPGCPLVSTQRRRELRRQRGNQPRPEAARITQKRYENAKQYLLTEDSLQMLREQAGLKPLPPPPAGWPPFSLTPPANPVMRTSLTYPLPMLPGTAVPALVVTPEAAAAAHGAMHTSGQPQGRGGASRATAVLIVAAALVAGTAAVAALWTLWFLQRHSPKGRRRCGEECEHPWPRRFPCWKVRKLADGQTVYAVVCGACTSISVFQQPFTGLA